MKTLNDYFNELCKNAGSLFKTNLIETKKVNTVTWENLEFNSDVIRYGHIEYFKANNNKVEVVHAMCYPNTSYSYPIFGFDVIALGGSVTGLFCDVTPLPYDSQILRKKIQDLNSKYSEFKRNLPEWTTMFSPDFIAVSPKEKFNEIANNCVDLFELYLRNANKATVINSEKSIEHKNMQNKYSEYQQKNTKTVKALATYIGEEEASKFMKDVLFPIIN